ncbi:MAG: rRNA maturation RNase YbeY [Planctomycetota bacterium]|nr:rRNA maturation RNase YbeY [Planctomycetota bacterium]
MNVELMDQTGRLSASDQSWIRARASNALELLKAPGEVRVSVVDDVRMAEAHERYSGVPGTTDVLTFDLREGPEGPLDTDVLVCLDEAQRRGQERGHGAREELLLYVVHAMLHCLGFDDHDEAEAAMMHAEEDRVLTALGVGVVYARPLAAPKDGARA